MPADPLRQAHLLQLRDGLFEEMEAAEREFARLRLLVERMESDVRIGRPAPASFSETKGRLLPQAEARLVELFRDLLKIEDKIRAAG